MEEYTPPPRVGTAQQQRNQRAKLAEKWATRMKRLRKRKTDPLTAELFCARYSYPLNIFSRQCNGLVVPNWTSAETIERAFHTEGV